MEDFIKEQNFSELTDKEKNLQLMRSILQTQNDLKQAHVNFEFAEDDLIDFYSYQIKANQAKLDYLTKLAKSKNIEVSLNNVAI